MENQENQDIQEIETIRENAIKKEFNNIEYQKIYYQKNKDKLLEKLKEKSKCEICNGSYSYVSKNRHLNSEKHKRFVLSNSS